MVTDIKLDDAKKMKDIGDMVIKQVNDRQNDYFFLKQAVGQFFAKPSRWAHSAPTTKQ